MIYNLLPNLVYCIPSEQAQQAELEKWNKSKGSVNPQGASSKQALYDLTALHESLDYPSSGQAEQRKLDVSGSGGILPFLRIYINGYLFPLFFFIDCFFFFL